VDSDCTRLENNASEAMPLGERPIGLFDDIDVSGLGGRDSVYGGWELGHGRTRDGNPWAKDPKTSSIRERSKNVFAKLRMAFCLLGDLTLTLTLNAA